MTPTKISIPDGNEHPPIKSRCFKSLLSQPISSTKEFVNYNKRHILHSIKVGTALVVVSLMYLLDSLYKQVGENAMWAIMTVVVMFEFSAGATLSKGLNRITGTTLGGGFGCLVTVVAHKVGGVDNSITIGTSVFVFGAAATYTRMIPSIKKRYDYGVMIFVLTFNLVVVSGVREEKVIELARDRLATIGIGFTICCFTSLFIFPMSAGEELHCHLASEFDCLAHCIEGFFEEYFKQSNEKEYQCGASFEGCKKVLNSKSKDELLANFARWEPWHGKFGLSYPWNQYLQIGEIIQEVAATTLLLKELINVAAVVERAVRVSLYSITWTLRELGDSIMKMKKHQLSSPIDQKLQFMRHELHLIVASSGPSILESGEKPEIESFLFLLTNMMEKVKILAKEVEVLGELANFQPQ